MDFLTRLADRCGIEASYRDAHGEMRHTSPETSIALLAAMGIRADTPADVAAALDALDRDAWATPLPPVQVAPCHAVAIDLTLPSGTSRITWHIALETGASLTGTADFATLPLLASHSLDATTLERRRLPLGGDLPQGYHRLTLHPGHATTTLIVTPTRCWLPPEIASGRRLWGVAAQLYLLRSNNNWGIGDYSDLRALVDLVGQRGADIVGLNPLHAMFLDDPEHASPYSPASRLLLNVLNIDIAALPELAACDAARRLIESDIFQQRLAACRAAQLVDYSGVAALKLDALGTLFVAGRDSWPADRSHAFEAFRRDRGAVLERGCLFQALREHFATQGEGADWHAWPAAYQNPDSPEIAAFAAAHADRISFRVWLQFLADDQLATAATAATAARHMAVGLYRDLAVGADKTGAETWSDHAAVVDGAQVGAPPDIYNPAGQDWALPPFHPGALRAQAYRGFIDLLRANMRHAGALRIDHVMALQQLYWIPAGKSPAEGAYVRYPLADLVGILALESQRHRCLVVGEDLGTVPAGFRECMEQAAILSYRVLFFEQDEPGFLAPDRYPPLALAVAGSHDLPTLRGWWDGTDIDLRERLHLFPDPQGPALARSQREQDRIRLVEALRHEDLLPAGAPPDAARLILAAHAFLARSRSALAMVQMDDITDEADPVNVPTTSDEHPNWRRRLSTSLEDLSTQTRLDTLAGLFRTARQ